MHNDVVIAHQHSVNHRQKVERDSICGCFYCLEIFSPAKIIEWIPDKIDETALCPYCGIDSIIGASSGFPITLEFLTEMQKHWF